MVSSVNETYSDRTAAQQSLPKIVELVGPAGSGKTTLSRVLCQDANRSTVMGFDIELRRPRDLPRFLLALPTLLPLVVQRQNRPQNSASRPYDWDEVKALAYLSGWHTVFKDQAAQNNQLVLLDHGPIFRLAKLHSYGPPQLREPAAQPWWDNMFRQWGTTLDQVIWLDAPNAILAERIKKRNQRHVLKEKSGEDVDRFLDQYRQSYETILTRLATDYGLRVLRFDTSQMTIDQVINAVKAVCISPIERGKE